MRPLNLAAFKFPSKTTDQEKIIFAKTRSFTIRQMREAFHFGNDKICRVIKEFNRSGRIPEPPEMHKKTKMTTDVLLELHQIIFSDAHVTLGIMQKEIKERLHIAISLSSIAVGCKTLRYQYKPPQHTLPYIC